MPRSPQLRLSTVCTEGQILHELFHVLGFAHEHSRPDRDDYIQINCENIARNLTQNFRRLKKETVHTFDVPYDFYSIMHYRLDHFSANGQPTIEPLDSQLELNYNLIGLMKVLSQGDIYRLNKLYHCKTLR
uniref:Metalloendopeptidase n=1 Tax=Plectus sambesii TaxID=2011161 RepID=A0A914USN9_9BILA